MREAVPEPNRRGDGRHSTRAVLFSVATPGLLRCIGPACLALATVVSPAHAQLAGGVIHTIDVPAPSLRGNLIGDPDHRAVSIYLPPSYSRARTRRYPVLYLLHGFGGDNYTAWITGRVQDLDVRISMDSLIRSGRVGEMILVMPNARNRFDGSFYSNSPTTGNWEDFIARDLVRYTDSHFRTIRNRGARGLAGHSMGGFGAFRIGMDHPDIFSAIYALSPCCLTANDTKLGWMTSGFKTTLRLRDTSEIAKAGFYSNMTLALSAVYSPDTARPPFFVDFPVRIRGDSLVADSAILKKWIPLLSDINSNTSALRRLRIGFDAGTADGFPDIPVNVRALDSTLTALSIPHFTELYQGNHGSKIRSRVENVVFPFFSAHFVASAAGRAPVSTTRTR